MIKRSVPDAPRVSLLNDSYRRKNITLQKSAMSALADIRSQVAPMSASLIYLSNTGQTEIGQFRGTLLRDASRCAETAM
jgi:hypothetical protein